MLPAENASEYVYLECGARAEAMATRRFAWVVAVGCLALVAAAAVPALSLAEMPFFHGGSADHRTGGPPIAPGPYNVTFVETGLPSGTSWSAEVCGLPSGGPDHPDATPAWHQCDRNSTVNGSLAYPVPNGSYQYRIDTVDVGNATYGADPSAGHLVVNGSGVTIDVAFAILVPYSVTFQESGLPNGTNWSVQLGGGDEWGGENSSNGTSVGFSLTNGTYAFSVAATENNTTVFVSTPASGNVSVNGSPVVVAIAFAPLVLYTVSFSESGLPNGTFWSVTLVGATAGAGDGPDCGGYYWNGSTNATVNFTVPDGTYAYSIDNTTNGSTVYVPTPSGGSVAVNGSAVTVEVAFAPLAKYTVTFAESGLPSGTFWAVALTGSTVVTPETPACGGYAWNGSTNATLTFTLSNGTYGFVVGNTSNGSSEYLPSPAAGNLTVDGGNVTVDVSFAAVALYNVTFNETGLPNGTAWWIVLYNASGGVEFNASEGNTISFALTNGSYNFSVWSEEANCTTSAYTPTPASGTVTVSGSGVIVRVTFTSG